MMSQRKPPGARCRTLPVGRPARLPAVGPRPHGDDQSRRRPSPRFPCRGGVTLSQGLVLSGVLRPEAGDLLAQVPDFGGQLVGGTVRVLRMPILAWIALD